MALADTVQEKHEPCSCEYASSADKVEFRLANLQVFEVFPISQVI